MTTPAAPRRIALTGGIASGKSTAARIFQALGAVVLDADEAARAVVAPGSRVLAEVAAALGPEAIHPSGHMDRAWVGAKVFAEPEARAKLNAIVHPAVRAWMGDRQAAAEAQGPAVVIQMIPLLFEGGLEAGFEESWLLAVDAGTQLQRLMERDGLSAEAAQARVAAQMPLSEKRAKATRVLDNEAGVADLAAACGRLWAEAGLPLGWPAGPHPRPAWCSPELAGLLAWDRACHAPEFGGGLSNHLPMALMARAELGDSVEGLVAFAEGYAARLAEGAGFLARTQAIEARLRQGGLPALREALAPHALGFAGAAFHGLIRLAFGLKAQEVGEVAAGLAYLEACAVRLGPESPPLPPPLVEGPEGLAALAAAASRLHALGLPPVARDTITPALQAAAQAPGFDQAAGGPWPLGDDPAASLARFGALVHAVADDFVGLHMLTGAEAYGWVRPHLALPEQADQAMAHALLCAHVVLGSPRLEGRHDPPLPQALPWEALRRAALASQNDHLPKLLVALHLQHSETAPSTLACQLASRAALRGHA